MKKIKLRDLSPVIVSIFILSTSIIGIVGAVATTQNGSIGGLFNIKDSIGWDYNLQKQTTRGYRLDAKNIFPADFGSNNITTAGKGTFNTLVSGTGTFIGDLNGTNNLLIMGNGDISGTGSVGSLVVGGNTVINSNGKWVGSIAGLQGIQGPMGATGDTGNTGATWTKGLGVTSLSCNTGEYLVGIDLVNGTSTCNTLQVDTTPPVLSSTTKTFITKVGTPLTLVTVTATDAVDGTVPVIKGGTKLDFNAVGTYTVTYSATDGIGNTSTITHTYQVIAITFYPGCDTQDILVGKYIMSACNVGTNIAGTGTSSYGGLFQFGRSIEYPGIYSRIETQYDWKTPGGTNTGSANDWGVQEANKTTATYANVSAADKVKMQGPCATGYHVPTNAEWVGIYTAGGWDNNFVDKGTNMSNALKTPIAGSRIWTNGSISAWWDSVGYYWSSSPNGAYGYLMRFKSYYIGINDSSYRSFAFSVRCFKN